jgi:hypothetical protein
MARSSYEKGVGFTFAPTPGFDYNEGTCQSYASP